MAQYIDKDALVTKINAFKKDAYNTWKWDTFHTLNELLSFINTLEVKEVDFEKELNKIWFNNKFGNKFNDSAVDFANVEEICKYFFELGLKAQKGEEV